MKMEGNHNFINGRRVLRGLCRGMGVLLAALLLVSWAHAQVTQIPVCRFSLNYGWNNVEPPKYIVRQADPYNDSSGLTEVVRQINRALAISPEFDVFILEGDDNAFATIANGRRILAIDLGFVDRLNRKVGTDWAAISIIAHEVGHHIEGFSPGSSLQRELNADYWSGQVLQRLGSSRRAATRAILTVGTDSDTATHPNRWDRAEKIWQGWDDASQGRIDYSHCLNCQ